MDFATTDLVLAILHHLLVFALAAVLAFEIGVVRPGLSREDIKRVARVDLSYGLLAGAILVVGITRAHIAAKGWAYYSVNPFFWAKMAAFALVGLLSIIPTIAFIRWKRAPDLPAPAAIATVRRYLWAEAILFGVIAALAATMARVG